MGKNESRRGENDQFSVTTEIFLRDCLSVWPALCVK